jgi:hypothetical protein
MIVEIDDDFTDKIISAAIIQSYLWCKEDLKREKAKPGTFHEDDVESWKKLVPALEKVGRYFTFDWESALKKASKKK